MPLSYRQLSSPTIEPVSLMLAKSHLRVYFDNDDSYITSLIVAAREHVESVMHRAIFNRKMVLSLDYFPWPGWDSTTGTTTHDYFMHWYYRGLSIRLPMPNAVSVESITYLSLTTQQPVTIPSTQYTVDTDSEPARIAPAPGYTWPYQQNYIPGQVKVNYTAGSWETAVEPETFTVPSAAPYTYTLAQASALVTITSVTDVNGNAVSYTNTDGTLTFTSAVAGETLTANYTVSTCPQSIIQAMLLLIQHWYLNRSAVTAEKMNNLPLAVDALVTEYKFSTFSWD